MPHTDTQAAALPQCFPHSNNHGKRTGAQQAEHRVANVIQSLELARRTALARGKPRLASKFELQRAGALMALEAVAELIRNHEGRE